MPYLCKYHTFIRILSFYLFIHLVLSPINKDDFNELKDFVENNDLANDSVYNIVKQYMDIDNVVKYISCEVFLRNDDWGKNNQKFFKEKGEGHKWRWILQDLDKGSSYHLTDNFLNKVILSGDSSKFSIVLFKELFKNKKFRDKYISISCLTGGSVYTRDRVDVLVDSFYNNISEEYPYYVERWDSTGANHWRNRLTNGVKDLKSNAVTLINNSYRDLKENFNLGEIHSLNISSDISGVPMIFNGIDVPVLPYDGYYFENRNLTLISPEYFSGMKFDYWAVDINGNIEKIYNDTLFIVFSDSTNIKANYTGGSKAYHRGLYINELSAGNEIFADNAFKEEDWIELFNNGGNSVDLGGYYLTDDPEDLKQFKFVSGEETTIEPYGYKVIWCSKKTERGLLHTNFKLSSDGETVILSKEDDNGNLEIIDSISYLPHSDYGSVGRYPDGGSLIVKYGHPSFCSKNVITYSDTALFEQYIPLVYDDIDEVKNTEENLMIISEKGALAIYPGKKKEINIYSAYGVLIMRHRCLGTYFRVELPKGIYLVNNKKATVL